MTFSIGTTPAAALPRATASNTSRKLPSDVRSTSPNAARTASSAKAPGSPAYATDTESGLGGTRWGRVGVADRVVGQDDLGHDVLEQRLQGRLGVSRCRCRGKARRGRLELRLGGLQRVELGADERARDGLERDECRFRVGDCLLVIVDRRGRSEGVELGQRLAV